MTSAFTNTSGSNIKPLPPISKDDKLPAPPPDVDNSLVSPPSLPPKTRANLDASSNPARTAIPGDIGGSSTAATMDDPSAPSDAKAKKSNPLIDLMETEKMYVEQLTGIIRKIAGAWSRSNLPPPELDSMFRGIEGVYKANRTLLSKLKEIGTNPSSPKALGDLLMRWIDDLDAPYSNFCGRFRTGFDDWEPVQSNPRLPEVLAAFSAAMPPTASPQNPLDSRGRPLWMLDSLFLLPKARLKYYRKLYNRLMKSTTPGRSDHRLLQGALDKLDGLLGILDNNANVKVSLAAAAPMSSAAPPETEDEVVIDLRTRSSTGGEVRSPLDSEPRSGHNSAHSSMRGSSQSSGNDRLSRDTTSTSLSRGSTATMSMPISDLERRLSTERTLDIFTMTPKMVRLQMSPPNLPFTRELKVSADVIIRFVPRATGQEVIHRYGHIFLLSDLFLVCERMTPGERVRGGPNGPDMWLCYPPLAAKVLRVADIPGQAHCFEVAIMKKEALIFQADSQQSRDSIVADLKECIEFSSSLRPPSKDPTPPVPSLPRSPSAPSVSPPPPPYTITSGNPSRSRSEGPSRASSPQQLPSTRSSLTNGAESGSNIAQPMSRLTISTNGAAQERAQPPPNLHQPMSMPMSSQVASSSVPYGHGPPPMSAPPGQPMPIGPGQIMPIGPGQIMPPQRSTSVGSSHPPPGPRPGFPANQSMPPPPGAGPSPLAYRPPINNSIPPGMPPNGMNPHALPPRQDSLGVPPGPQLSADPSMRGMLRKSPSTPALPTQHDLQHQQQHVPRLPNIAIPNGHPMSGPPSGAPPHLRPLLPSATYNARQTSGPVPSFHEPSPPGSPVEETPPVTGPVTSTISAQMKCKVFLQQHHAQWKALGSARLKLYRQEPTNVKQLVVESDSKSASILISTIVLTDGVERVGKTGVAIELSDKGARTGIVYMIQLRNETSAGGLFDSLLAGSDRAHP